MKNSFALLVLTALISILFSAKPANADSATTRGPELLTYSKLMKLPADARVKYVEGVRAILVDLAKRSDGKFSDRDPASRSRLKAWLELLDREMQTASAQTDEAAPAILIRRPSRTVETITGRELARPTHSVSEFVMRGDLDAVQYQCASVVRIANSAKSAGLPKCTLETEAKIKAAFQTQNPRSAAIESALTPLPTEADMQAPRTRGLSLGGTTISEPSAAAAAAAVVPAAPVAADRPPAPVIVATPPVAAPGSVADPAAILNGGRPAAETAGAAPPIALKPQISRRITFDEMSPYLGRKENPNKICLDEAKKIGADAMDLVSIEGSQDRYCMTKAGEELYHAGQLPLPDGGPPSVADGKLRSANGAATTAGAASAARGTEKKYACAPKPDVCEAPKSKADAIFPGGIPCVFAGMLSKFDNGNRKCQPQTEFKLADKTYSCAVGQTMCNPLLFGTVNTTTAICIGRGANATEQCSKLSSSLDAEKFLNRAESGLQEKWNDFRKGLADTCKAGSTSAKFHCAECNIMKTRLFNLHARLLKDPCADGDNAGSSAVDGRIKSKATGGGTKK